MIFYHQLKCKLYSGHILCAVNINYSNDIMKLSKFEVCNTAVSRLLVSLILDLSNNASGYTMILKLSPN